jgi:hypothetical protein
MLNSVQGPKTWLTLSWIGIGLLALLIVLLLARRLAGEVGY